MAKQGIKHFQLGIFVTAGLAFLLIMLYMIGKNKHLMGKSFHLRARFENVQGLKKGNNVRFAGIDAGTVENIEVINDTLIEVYMRLDANLNGIIRDNAIVSIGTDGLVGNKIINIQALRGVSTPAIEESLLQSRKPVDTDEMLQTFSKTNRNLKEITHHIQHVSAELDTGAFVQALLTDTTIIHHLKHTALSINMSSMHMQKMLQEMRKWVQQVNQGKGVLGALLYDTLIMQQVHQTVGIYQRTGEHITQLADSVRQLTLSLQQTIDTGNGMLPYLWKDNLAKEETKAMIRSANKATQQINEVLDALKHSFFFRRYFRKKNQLDP
jgi:phospholipid/cholesterol/gamma-HCH transport system substrate-binding protein